MTCSQLIGHLDAIRREYGDIEVRVDADIFRDSLPRDVTSVSAARYYVKPIGMINIGQYTGEGTTRVILYVGNEPKQIIGGQGV